ncbi:MAG: putative toxin-antitoxin system toxin component, PIN family [Syntrophorhabdaceae bacterium]|nr:putative toxin-antitoxin system toxin component, PIN family [Syntrophorhabdaceae bacterium]
MKAVFDTNVLIAAFLTEGVCSKLLVRARKGECDLILSQDIIREFEKVLSKKFGLSRQEIYDVRAVLSEATKEIIRKVDPIEPVCRDKDDNKILTCALAADADLLVTGDEDLLVMKKYGRTRIISPREFEAIFAD